jgi:RNA polymerase sigma-70 factor, ECF subfamily
VRLGCHRRRTTIRAARLTDPATLRAFETTVLAHLDAAYNLARWLTRSHDDAEDVVQEACLRAFRYYRGFHGENARTWLLAIVRNTCFTWLRNNRYRREVPLFEDDQYEDETESGGMGGESPGNDPETTLIRNADRALLNRLIGELPLPFREVLVLRELEDLSYKDIAEVAAVPIGTVMSRLSRARRLLQRAYAAHSTKEG